MPTTYTDELIESLTLSEDEGLTRYASELVQNVTTHDEPVFGWGMSLDETATFTEALIQNAGAVLMEALAATESASVQALLADVLTDNAALSERLLPGFAMALSETATLTEVLALADTIAIIEALQLTEAFAPALTYGLSLTETLSLVDALRNFFSGDITESLAASEALDAKFLAYPELVETLTLTDTPAQQMVFRVVAEDEIAATDEQLLNMIFNGTLTENVAVTAGYIGPNGNFTTWALNTRNLGVTEYTNYAFNSFAQMGDRYLAASSSGLYELDGDTDAGASIIADIKSGRMQLGGSKFTSFKAAYIGMTGSGNFVLRLETGDGKTYDYAVVGKSGQSARVHFGKGLRARYFSFELISTGQDFDLDNVEFLPLVAQRRV